MQEERDSEKKQQNERPQPIDEYRIVSSLALADDLAAKRDPKMRLTSDLPSLEKAVEGFQPGELISISGPTKHGKTLFAQTLTADFSKQNYFPLWFSYEVSPKYFLRGFSPLPLFYIPNKLKGNNLQWVIGKMIESKRQYHTTVVFIDHLHYLFELNSNNRSLEIGAVIRSLKKTAVDNDLIIFLMCHTVKGATGANLDSGSIRDSSFITQESDCVIMISRNTKNVASGEAMIMVEFHRRTGAFRVPVHIKKIDKYFKEVAPD